MSIFLSFIFHVQLSDNLGQEKKEVTADARKKMKAYRMGRWHQLEKICTTFRCVAASSGVCWKSGGRRESVGQGKKRKVSTALGGKGRRWQNRLL